MTKKRTSAVDINDIVCDERCQPRAILNPEAVEEYAEIYKEGEVDLPALEVCKVGDDLVLINGFHRLAGARQADHGFVRVTTVEQCDMGRAMWLAAAMNQGCGVRRSNKDKRRAVELALASDIGQEQSSRQIAEHIGVSKDLVRRMKEDWEAENKAKPEPGAGGFKATPPTDDDTPPTTTGAQEVPADVSDDEVNQDDEASPAPPPGGRTGDRGNRRYRVAALRGCQEGARVGQGPVSRRFP